MLPPSHSHRARVHATFFREKRMKKRWKGFLTTTVVCILVAIASYLTNPFTRYSAVQTAFTTRTDSSGQLVLVKDVDLFVRSNIIYRSFSKVKSAYHILGNVYERNKKTQSTTLPDIIREIHQIRFNPDHLYLISGDHFSTLYIRSLGIFYATLLDPRTAIDQEDWLNRQKIYLQTTAYALEVFSQSSALSTTIVPVGQHSVTLLNIYQPPSDSLFSLLYAIRTMQSSDELLTRYPFPHTQTTSLQTQQAAQQLLQDYKTTLLRHYNAYIQSVVDSKTGLIKSDILLSGTKDIAKRQSAFYDNVILWKTQQLAQEEGIVPKNAAALEELRQNILNQYWIDDKGYFLEDVSPAAIKNSYYSSDWLIVLQTGFLNPQDPVELPYFERSVSYIRQNKIDQPFGLKYQTEDRPEREYSLVRFFVPEYGGTAIWSHWGMEYIKLLVLLYQQTGKAEYLALAESQLQSYSNNIIKYRCYPEVYDAQGRMLKNFFYKSVCQTGWVVNYEQAARMIDSAKQKLVQ